MATAGRVLPVEAPVARGLRAKVRPAGMAAAFGSGTDGQPRRSRCAQASAVAGKPLPSAARARGASGRRSVVARAEAKDIVYNEDSRRAIQRGIDKLADAVGVTLGPRGACGAADASARRAGRRPP